MLATWPALCDPEEPYLGSFAGATPADFAGDVAPNLGAAEAPRAADGAGAPSDPNRTWLALPAAAAPVGSCGLDWSVLARLFPDLVSKALPLDLPIVLLSNTCN